MQTVWVLLATRAACATAPECNVQRLRAVNCCEYRQCGCWIIILLSCLFTYFDEGFNLLAVCVGGLFAPGLFRTGSVKSWGSQTSTHFNEP